ncbi:MAG: hypothetical protein JSR86_22390 [Proteobacteria bacterium]|nr:hypothetical protein [Pseudomonadota bacterium]
MKDVHDLLAAEREWGAACAERAPQGWRIARIDAAILRELAQAIRASVMIWADMAADLDLAAVRPLDQGRAARLVAEAVFDDLMDPAAWRVLTAALDREAEAGA